ncbi:MAG: HEPN family nuclease [Candidatus Omnitrophota bacterium]
MNEKITGIAYIEAQILHQASAQGLLSPAVRSIEAEYGLQHGSLGSGVFLETRIISLLYSLIVVPKEFWKLSKNHPVYTRIKESWSLESVNIIVDKSHWEEPIYRFMHHLRNAIAHANFEFKSGDFEFWDQYRDKPETYRARLSTQVIQGFLEVVGSLLANLKNEIKA